MQAGTIIMNPYREVDFGDYPKGLSMDFQMMDSGFMMKISRFCHLIALDRLWNTEEKAGSGIF